MVKRERERKKERRSDSALANVAQRHSYGARHTLQMCAACMHLAYDALLLGRLEADYI